MGFSFSKSFSLSFFLLYDFKSFENVRLWAKCYLRECWYHFVLSSIMSEKIFLSCVFFRYNNIHKLQTVYVIVILSVIILKIWSSHGRSRQQYTEIIFNMKSKILFKITFLRFFFEHHISKFMQLHFWTIMNFEKWVNRRRKKKGMQPRTRKKLGT